MSPCSQLLNFFEGGSYVRHKQLMEDWRCINSIYVWRTMIEENLLNFSSAIATIARIAYSVYEVYTSSKSSRSRGRPINITRDEEDFYRTCVQQIVEKDEEHFYKATRMSVRNFNLLLTLLKEKMEQFSNRKAIDRETRLAVTIMYLAHGCSMQVLAWAYKLGISTVRKIVYETCEAIWDELHIAYLSPPKVNEFETIAQKFYVKTGMPNCLGAIDGKHIHIVCPDKSGSLYYNYNYKKTFSIVLMAACDANYVFTYIDVGALGSQSDGGVFARSEFGKKLLNGTLEIPRYANLPGTSINFPYYFVGDSAFPLKQNLMRPYPGHNLPQDKDKFNTKLSKARVHIENAFGILANRWRVLHTTLHMCPKNADKIVLAAVVLHNFLMLQNDKNYFTIELVDHSTGNGEMHGQWRQQTPSLSSYQPKSANRSSNAAFELRDILKEFLQNDFV